MSDVQSFIDENLGRFRSELYDFLRIPSVSAKSEHDGDTRAAAEWFAQKLADAGLPSEIVDTPGHPVVVGESHAAGPDAPTVLIYGHYDVQPPEPLDLWSSPPFEPTERDGRVYARGSADDKGQLYMHVKALEAYHASGTPLPINVVVIAEGEEEVGSPNLVPFVVEHVERLACDVVLISDTGMYAEGLPSVGFSLRGLAYFEVHVHGANSDLHSGEFGGAVANPANVLSKIIASLHRSDGSIAIDGFYDDVLEWDEATRAQIASLPHSDDAFAAGSGSVATTWLSRSSDRASSMIRARSSGERKSRTLNTGGLSDIVSITSSASFPTGTCVISPSSVAFQRHSARPPPDAAADALLPLAIASAVLNRRCASAFWPSFCRMFPTRWWLLAWPGLSSMALRPCANASSCSSKSSESSTPRFTRASAFSGSAFCASRKCSSAAFDSPAS